MGRAHFDLWKPADSIAAPNTHVCVLASRSRVRRAGCVHMYAPDHISSQKEFCLSPGRREASNNALAPHHHEDFKWRSTSRHSTTQRRRGDCRQGAAGSEEQTSPPSLLPVWARSCPPNQVPRIRRALRAAATAGLATSRVLLSACIQMHPLPDTDAHTSNSI